MINTNITVKEFSIQDNKVYKTNIKELINNYKDSKYNFVILKGTRKFNNKLNIVYIICKDDKCKILENIYKNNKCIKITKKNKVKNSYFEFSTWDIMRLGNGQMTGSNMNMVNDSEEYNCYIVI